MKTNGTVEEVLSLYRSNFGIAKSTESLLDVKNRRGAQGLKFELLYTNATSIEWGENLVLRLKLKTISTGEYKDLEFGIALQDEYNKNLIHLSNKYIKKSIDRHLDDDVIYSFEIENNLRQGRYSLVLFMRANDIIQDWISDFIYIEIPEGNQYGYHNSSEIQGLVLPNFNFSFESRPS
jgi:hypothetical protein